MKEIDEATISQWLDLDLENELEPASKRELEQQLKARPELVAEQRMMAGLHEMLHQSKIAVQEDFSARVMESLPEPAWSPRQTSGWLSVWGFPAALVLSLGIGAFLILGGSAADSHMGGIFGAVADLLTSTLLAGSGLLFATWRGIGFGVEELLGGSKWNLAAFGAGVLCLNLLLYSLLKRRSARVAEVVSESSPRPGSRS